jgi:hypothetical protein
MVYKVKERISGEPLVCVNEHDLIESVVIGITEQGTSSFLQESLTHPKV